MGYLNGQRVANGQGFTPASGTNLLLVWMAYCYRGGVAVGSNQQFGGVAMTEQAEANTNISGNGDPTANISTLINPNTSVENLTLDWDRTATDEDGFAITLDNVDQAAAIVSANAVAYGNEASPSLTIPIIGANDTVIYFKYHAASSAPTYTTPTGFDVRENFGHLTTPAYRGFYCATRTFATAQSNYQIGANTGDSPTGGVHGYLVVKAAAAPTTVTIGDVDTDNVIERSQSGIVLTGTNFEANTGEVIASPTDDINDANAITISTSAWSDTSITFDMPSNPNLLYGNLYFFVRTDSSEENASGKLVNFIPPSLNSFVTIENLSDFGLLSGTSGIELGKDQLEFQKTSQGGGTVYVGISGTFLIYNYSGSAPASDEIYIRLGDSSDLTWSSAGLQTISIGGSTPISLNSAEGIASGTASVSDITSNSQLNSVEGISLGVSSSNAIAQNSKLSDVDNFSLGTFSSTSITSKTVLNIAEGISSGIASTSEIEAGTSLTNVDSVSMGVSSAGEAIPKTSLDNVEGISLGVSSAQDLGVDQSLNNVEGVSLGIQSSAPITAHTALDNAEGISLGTSSSISIELSSALANSEGISAGVSSANPILPKVSFNNVEGISSGTSSANSISLGQSLSDVEGLSIGTSSSGLLATRTSLSSAEGVALGVFNVDDISVGQSLNNVEGISIGSFSAEPILPKTKLDNVEGVSSGVSSSEALGDRLLLDAAEGISMGVSSVQSITPHSILLGVESFALSTSSLGQINYLPSDIILSSFSRSKNLDSISKTVHLT